MKLFPYLFILISALMFCGCTTKAMVVDGKKYTQTWGSNEWKYSGEVKPVEQNASKPEESIGYAAGKAAGATVYTGAYAVTLPIRIIENIAK